MTLRTNLKNQESEQKDVVDENDELDESNLSSELLSEEEQKSPEEAVRDPNDIEVSIINESHLSERGLMKEQPPSQALAESRKQKRQDSAKMNAKAVEKKRSFLNPPAEAPPQQEKRVFFAAQGETVPPKVEDPGDHRSRSEEADQEEAKAADASQAKVGNIEKFKSVTSRSGFKTLTAVALLFVFPIAFVISSVSTSVPFFEGLQQLQTHESLLINDQFGIYYKLYLQVIKDMVTGRSQPAPDISDPDLLQTPYYRSQYDYLQSLKFEGREALERLRLKHISVLNPSQDFVQSLESSQYCSVMKERSVGFNYTYCQTVDNGIALEQGIHIQMERVMGEIAKLRNAFERRPMNLTRVFKELLNNGDQTLAKFQLMMDRMFTPTYQVIKAFLQEQRDSLLSLQKTIDSTLLATLVVLHLTLILGIAWPRFLSKMTDSIGQSRGILTLIPNKFILKNKGIKAKVLGSKSRKILAN